MDSQPVPNPPPQIAPTATAAPTEAAQPAAPPSLDLRGPRTQRQLHSWVWIAVPVGGLLVIPIIGLVYAATASFVDEPPSSSARAAGSDLADDDDEPGPTGTKATRRKAPRSRAAAGGPKRHDEAAVCCNKLEQLGRTAPMEERGAYVAGAAACKAAPDAERAFAQAASVIGGSRGEVPEECQPP